MPKSSLVPIDHDPFDEGKKPDLSPVEWGFLKLLGAVDNIGGRSTSLKIYNDVIQRGRSAPITEEDFTPSELNNMRSLVQEHAAKNGVKAGHIDYKDYPGGNMLIANRPKESREIMNTLGGFDYAINPDDSINVTDKYDFNADRAGSLDNNIAVQAISLLTNPRDLAASIGRKVLPDTGGRGVPVSINLTPVNHDPFAQ